MVGRLRDNRLIVQGVGSSDAWPALLEKKNVSAGFRLEIQKEPMLYTDVTPFYRKEIPVLSFFTGVHEEYNRPADKPATLDYGGLERIALFAKRIAEDLAGGERPAFREVAVESERKPGASSDRPYLGTIPDYVGGDEKGVKLSGVKEGGPAERGGLRGGDVIIRFAGSDIGNIRDYASMLDVVKIGEPVEVTVLRDGEEKIFTVVPEARR
jgi:C-terminal processing protease CtpA/Prc